MSTQEQPLANQLNPLGTPRLTCTVFEAKGQDWTPTDADDGKIFTVSISPKLSTTCTLSGLSTGTHFKILVISGTVLVESPVGDVYGYTDVGYRRH